MSKTPALSLSLSAVLGLALVWGTSAPAQDAPRDDVLDGLLKKIEEKDPKPAAAPTPKSDPAQPASRPDAPAARAAASRPEAKAKAKDKDKDKDKDLENLLEKLGATDDAPTPEDHPKGPGGGRGEPRPGDQPPADSPDKENARKTHPDALTGKDKALDEHIEEILGKRKKKKQDDGGGALSQVVKEMREVEERLGKPDTGEETRKKQDQIVKQIETLIEQARTMQGQPKSKKSMKIAQGKQQPGQPQNGEQPGATGGNAPFTKPEKPTDRRSLAGGKEVWGMLPPEVRQELDNVAKEGFLLSREELIQRYYLSLSRKKTNRGE